jgi:hypothetical protein
MSASSACTDLWALRRGILAVSSANHRSTWFSHELDVGVKCMRNRAESVAGATFLDTTHQGGEPGEGAPDRTGRRAGSVLTPHPAARRLPAETAPKSTITQIYEGTNQIQRVVMARQLLKVDL